MVKRPIRAMRKRAVPLDATCETFDRSGGGVHSTGHGRNESAKKRGKDSNGDTHPAPVHAYNVVPDDILQEAMLERLMGDITALIAPAHHLSSNVLEQLPAKDKSRKLEMRGSAFGSTFEFFANSVFEIAPRSI